MNVCTKCGKMYIHKPCPNCGNIDSAKFVIYDITEGYDALVKASREWTSEVYKFFATAPILRVAGMLYGTDNQTAIQYASWLQTDIRKHTFGSRTTKKSNSGRKSKFRLLLESKLDTVTCVYLQQTLFHAEIRRYFVCINAVEARRVQLSVGYMDICKGAQVRGDLGTIWVPYDSKMTFDTLCKIAIMKLNGEYALDEHYLSLDS